MTLAVCPGSFDPLTLGHMDVIRRARAMFDEVIVAVGHNAKKTYLFSIEERVELARQALADIDAVRVEATTGLIAEFAQKQGAAAIVKGLRGGADYDAEQAMALLNRHLSGIETVFVMGDPALAHIASSFVKEIASYGGRIDDLVAPNVARALRKVNS
ncbi:pantetheine-phosphate adenylyltransferase [Trueperella pyogenes]|uniref:Phosphopantetheine adenylyltransferase n=1 Tax=Trueperella pyogenes TaxID=1661 RepID=X4QTR4_9ACTO|nr:pantetheine-phosphate adenylyltransferase [Trueperella pyogenes]AHU89218.1 phosphopantetheine adenylyltransferase [Trueperella pyogenes]AJC69410.1 pantetheine-phosphate adenylyltransferase [Trueperella pyogenes TP8]ALD74059.1 phosphopantetheine adenylyltransferase [Trueperella pyogenes]AWA43161.1 pantetheine-phosphate adenylyltransferase [Trueperella pyogenes]AWG04436.1 pantetheine-phosphate adenylyltransferase [Trueperella pyogenes]